MKSKLNLKLFSYFLKCWLRLDAHSLLSVRQHIRLVQLKPHKFTVANNKKAGVKFETDRRDIRLLRSESFHNILMGVGSAATQSAGLLIINLWLFAQNLREMTAKL